MPMKAMNLCTCIAGKVACKYWIDEEMFDLQEAYSFGMSPKDKKQIRKILFEHFDYIVQQWKTFKERQEL